jgi:hypothetical protein
MLMARSTIAVVLRTALNRVKHQIKNHFSFCLQQNSAISGVHRAEIVPAISPNRKNQIVKL